MWVLIILLNPTNKTVLFHPPTHTFGGKVSAIRNINLESPKLVTIANDHQQCIELNHWSLDDAHTIRGLVYDNSDYGDGKDIEMSLDSPLPELLEGGILDTGSNIVLLSEEYSPHYLRKFQALVRMWIALRCLCAPKKKEGGTHDIRDCDPVKPLDDKEVSAPLLKDWSVHHQVAIEI